MNILNEMNNISARREEYEDSTDYRNDLLKNWTADFDAEAAVTLLRLYTPDLQTVASRETRRERRALSERARGKWAKVLGWRIFGREFQEDVFGQEEVNRGILALLNDAIPEDSETNDNAQIVEVIKSHNVKALSQLVRTRISEAAETIKNAEGKNDEQLIDDFVNVRNACRLMWDIRELAAAADGKTLDAEMKATLEEMRDKYEMRSKELMARLMLISNPIYENVDLKELQKVDLPKLRLDMMLGLIPEKLNQSDGALTELIGRAGELQSGAQQRKETAIKAYFSDRFSPEELENIQVLDPADGSRIGSGRELNLGNISLQGAVVAVLPDGEVKAFFPLEDNGKKVSLHEGTETQLFNIDTAERLEGLYSLADSADPWYMMIKGSAEFKHMKEVVERVGEQFQPLGAEPSRAEKDAMNASMTELLAATDTYLGTKDMDNITTPLERSRILAAQQIQRFAREKLAQLELVERRLARQEELASEPYMAEGKLNSAIRATMNRQTQVRDEFTSDMNLKTESLWRLGVSQVGSTRIMKLAAKQGAYTPEEKETVRRYMATMMCQDVILTERRINGGAKTGAMESILNKHGADTFVKVIEQTDIFQRLTRDVTPQRLSDFIANNGEKALAKELLSGAKAEKDAQAKQAGEKNAEVKNAAEAKNAEAKQAEVKNAEAKKPDAKQL